LKTKESRSEEELYTRSTVSLCSPVVHLYDCPWWSTFAVYWSPSTFGLQRLQLCSFDLRWNPYVRFSLATTMFNVCSRIRYIELNSEELNKKLKTVSNNSLLIKIAHNLLRYAK